MKSEEVKAYFEANAATWILDAYEQSGYNYPTPFHRLRILRSLMKQLGDVRRVVDVGCGGGQVALGLAADGIEVVGVDESTQMIEHARERLSQAPLDVQARVTFERGSLLSLSQTGFDAMTAMGVIGYLPDDDAMFRAAGGALRRGGYLLVSFRNRLFNLFPGSNAQAALDGRDMTALATEAAELSGTIDEAVVLAFLRQLHAITGELLADPSLLRLDRRSPSQSGGKAYSTPIRPRQTSPQEAREAAARCGFETVDMRGVHPHLVSAALNEMLPPQVYHRLCDALTALEALPLSLVWSSVFIGVFRRT